MLKFFILFLVTFGMVISVNAATGCVLTSNKAKIYTSKSGSNYVGSPTTAPAGCVYVQSGSNCTITSVGAGKLGNTTSLSCPIDDYTWLILLSFAGLGFVYVRKKNLILN